jgi:hypothetical protein
MDAPTYAQQHQRPAQGFPQSRRKPINAYYEEDSHPLPRQEPEQPKQRSAHMHYSTEGSQPLPRADALEEWQGDDEEVAGM